MKKNKTYTMLLAGGVIILWVVVLFRFYKSFWGEGELITPKKHPEANVKIKTDINEQFVLKANYPDPFSGKAFNRETRSVASKENKKASEKTIPKKEEIKIDFSFINYLGLIRNQVNSKEVALVSVQGKEYMVAEGDKINEVVFLKNYKDSIKVSYMGATAYLRKQ